jgi:hypothetical protein
MPKPSRSMKTVTKTINIADRFFAATTTSSAADEPTAKQDQRRDEDQREDHRRHSQHSNGIGPMNSGSRVTMVWEGDRSRAGLLNQRLDSMQRRPRFFTSARIEFFSLCTVGGSVSVANVPHGNPEKALIFAPLTCLCSAELWTGLDSMATRIAADYAGVNPWNTDNRRGKVTECRCGRFT